MWRFWSFQEFRSDDDESKSWIREFSSSRQQYAGLWHNDSERRRSHAFGLWFGFGKQFHGKQRDAGYFSEHFFFAACGEFGYRSRD